MAEFPVTLTLRFRSEAARRAFVGGFVDGWGEDSPTEIENWAALIKGTEEEFDAGPWDVAVYSQDGPDHWSVDMKEIK